jgi:DNA-binding NarL/FixJ family response regulator
MRVVLVAAEPVFRLGFRGVIESSSDLRLVAEVADARAAFRAIDVEKPDLVVMDIALPGMSGVNATREVCRRLPGARVLLMADWARERDVIDGFAAGAQGFMLKSEPPETMLTAMRTVARGGRSLTPEVRGVKVEGHPRTKSDLLTSLTVRERDVLDLIVKGWRSRDIARELCVSIKTIETHRTRINRKLCCRSSADLIRFAADNGLLRHAPSGDTASRTILFIVDDDPALRRELLRDILAQGYRSARASSVTLALAEGQQSPTMFAIDDDATAADLYRHLQDPALSPMPMVLNFDAATSHHAVRTAISLPSPEAGEHLLAALDRARPIHSKDAA